MKIVVLNTASLGIIITSMMDEQSPICRKCIHCTRLGDKPTLLIANEQMTESALISIHPLKSHSLCQINIAIGHGTFTLSFLSAKRSILHSHVKAYQRVMISSLDCQWPQWHEICPPPPVCSLAESVP